MPKLFIANCSKQRHMFSHRRTEIGQMYYREIKPGEQIMVIDVSAAEMEAILSHHGQYGLINYRDIDQSKAFIGLCFSIDKAVPVSVIEKAIRDNDNHLDRAGTERRKTQIAATNDYLTREERGFRGDLGFETEEVVRPDGDKKNAIDEQLAVETGTTPRKPGRPKK